jgi:hypothetical protein
VSENRLKYELQNLLSGKSSVSHGTLILSIANHLKPSAPTGPLAQTGKLYKEEETEKLINYISQNKLWVVDLDISKFISQGAEQRVFILDEKHVFKLNDSIYYASWFDYLNNLLLNNYFFPDTAYKLTGFYKQDESLYAVVEQNYVIATHKTDLKKVKEFMENNGFLNIRNHDYYHPYLGIILEDLHDENVLTQNDILYFIDTVFYVKPEVFWN